MIASYIDLHKVDGSEPTVKKVSAENCIQSPQNLQPEDMIYQESQDSEPTEETGRKRRGKRITKN